METGDENIPEKPAGCAQVCTASLICSTEADFSRVESGFLRYPERMVFSRRILHKGTCCENTEV